jgi:FlaA1/EpsC-like NDP-sugar epimerase
MPAVRTTPRVSTAELLGRPEQVVYGDTARQLVAGSTVLVTGAGGSIGSELVRQLTSLQARTVYMLDHNEGALHALQLELAGHGLLSDANIILADIRDLTTLTRHFEQVEPDLVFHAAAHKHLPLLERFPAEGVKTNVLGSHNVAVAAARSGVARLVNVSTDKAASPTSVLGATKRFAEELTVKEATDGLRVANVRFGNVLGSRGSFLDSLTWQIDNGLPVTITDEHVTRYFMTIPEAAGLVIEAAVMAESGATYILDMGEPVRILDLVRTYAQLAEAGDPTIVFTGLRPGEKLHEELLDRSETSLPTEHPRIFKARGDGAALVADWRLGMLMRAAEVGDDVGMRQLLFDTLGEDLVVTLPEQRSDVALLSA